jgi:uncharacterized protein
MNGTTTIAGPYVSTAERPTLNPAPAAVAAVAIAAAAVYLNAAVSGRQSLLFLVGAFAGIVLYHAAFGFTSSWRAFLLEGRGAGIRAQMLMLALTCLVFFPALGAGHVGGQAVRGSVSPVGVSVIVGAFMFGVGMQLGGGCASGTLYTAGGGNTRMLATLAAFIAGSVIGSAHAPWWSAAPAAKPMSFVTLFGTYGGLGLSLVLFAAIAIASIAIERRVHGDVARSFDPRDARGDSARAVHASGPWRALQGPWPLAAGAAGLALVNIATLLLSGRPWSVTGAFALWGAKIASAAGVHVASWPYWAAPAQAASLKAPVVADVGSVMNAGIVLGALAAAAAAGRFAPTWRVPLRSLAAAIVGGLLLGYGARIAYGCNIGAYFSGIASGSVHGWLWMVAAFGGNAVGAYARPAFGLRR